MPWAKLDDGFHDHPKVDGLSLGAVGLWTLCFTWANRHRRTAAIPGYLPEQRVKRLSGRQFTVLTNELVTPPPGKQYGLWEVMEGGFLFHNFEQGLPKERDPAEATANARRAAAKRWGT